MTWIRSGAAHLALVLSLSVTFAGTAPAEDAAKPKSQHKAANGIHRLALSLDGRQLALGLDNGKVELLEAETLAARKTLPKDPPAEPECLAFRPDGKSLAVGTFDTLFTIWQLPEGTTHHRLNAMGFPVAAAFTPDGKHLRTYPTESGIGNWDASSGKTTGTVRLSGPGGDQTARDAVFSADASTLAVSGLVDSDHSVRVWSAADGKLRRHFTSYPRLVDRLVLSADGTRLATGSEDGMVRVWEVASGKSLAAYKVGGFITAVAISPNGTRVAASTDADSDARVWDLATGKLLTRLPGHENGARDLTFSPNGKQLYTASANVARLWTIP